MTVVQSQEAAKRELRAAIKAASESRFKEGQEQQEGILKNLTQQRNLDLIDAQIRSYDAQSQTAWSQAKVNLLKAQKGLLDSAGAGEESQALFEWSGTVNKAYESVQEMIMTGKGKDSKTGQVRKMSKPEISLMIGNFSTEHKESLMNHPIIEAGGKNSSAAKGYLDTTAKALHDLFTTQYK